MDERRKKKEGNEKREEVNKVNRRGEIHVLGLKSILSRRLPVVKP